jgi:ankyrin repeat protein
VFCSSDLVGISRSLSRQLVKHVRADDYEAVWNDLKAGADVNILSTNNTSCLHYACKQNNLELCSLLLHFGADVSCQTTTGWAALHFAVNLENVEMCKLLRAYGARVDQINEWLKAPTDMARDKKNQAIIDILKVSGTIC